MLLSLTCLFEGSISRRNNSINVFNFFWCHRAGLYYTNTAFQIDVLSMTGDAIKPSNSLLFSSKIVFTGYCSILLGSNTQVDSKLLTNYYWF